MKKSKAEKAAKPISGAAKPAKVVKAAEPVKVNPAQAIQGQMGKAQGYLGKFAGQALPQNTLKNNSPKKKKGRK